MRGRRFAVIDRDLLGSSLSQADIGHSGPLGESARTSARRLREHPVRPSDKAATIHKYRYDYSIDSLGMESDFIAPAVGLLLLMAGFATAGFGSGRLAAVGAGVCLLGGVVGLLWADRGT